MIKGLIFDLNGTVIDIYTGESDWEIYRVTANFLDYYGVQISADKLREEYFSLLRRQKKESFEEFPEFDVVALFGEIILRYGKGGRVTANPRDCAIVFRAACRYKLELYDGVRDVLDELKRDYRMAAVSDGQKVWAIPEMRSVGLDKYFQKCVVSSEYGFRKPDPRMFAMVLERMELSPEEVILIGNDMYRDIYGAHHLGMKTVFFRSNQGEQSCFDIEADYIIYNFRELPAAVKFLSA